MIQLKNKWIDFKKLKGELLFPIVLAHYNIDHKVSQDQDMVLCPFHDENTASCSVNKSKGVFRCFGCGTKGNVLEFVCEMEGLDPTVASDIVDASVIAIEQILGNDPEDYGRKQKRKGSDDQSEKRETKQPKKVKKTKAKKKKKTKSPDVEPVTSDTEETAIDASTDDGVVSNKVLTFELQNLDINHSFFKAHGISHKAVETFGLGFCERGIMKDRIVIPVHNTSGQLVAYAGRWPGDEVPKDTSRYKFPKGFVKSIELFNWHRAVELLDDTRTMFVVEGFWSAIRLHVANIPAVAVFGHSISETQAKLLAEHADRVVIIFDGDEAGRAGSEASVTLLSQHVFTRVVSLPNREKPDTMDLALLDVI